MTAPSTTPKALLLASMEDISFRLRDAYQRAMHAYRLNPVDEDTMPALIDEVDWLTAELVKWQAAARYQEGEPQ